MTEPTFDESADLGAEALADPCDPQWRDIRHQHVTADQYHRIVDVVIRGEWL